MADENTTKNNNTRLNTTGESGSPGEPAAGDNAAALGGQDNETLKSLLSKTEAEAAEYLDLLKRTQAEMENYRKRMIREQERIVECAAQNVVLELLPIIDNLERAIAAALSSDDQSPLLGGVELTLAQIKGVLKQQGVEEINPAGQEFDPQKHEAVMQLESPEHGENTVVEVIQKGYDLKGTLLRPAMVVVAK